VVEIAKFKLHLNKLSMKKHPITLTDLEGKYKYKPLEVLKFIEGYYKCPHGKNDERLGPLVAYAGTYEEAGLKLQYVGETYVNFAKADQYPYIMKAFAEWIDYKILPPAYRDPLDVICGPQMGGVAIAQMCALAMHKQFACAEKQVTQLANETLRQQEELAFLRHSIKPGDNVAIAEDVINNFSTTGKLVELVEKCGGTVTCIISMLNRSDDGATSFTYNGKKIPVFSLLTMKIPQWRQSDPYVSEDIINKNLVLKPKNEWQTLVHAMQSAEK
jgi:adenine/guanine phosphoribosyltransferase-like PRPP-binding protein